MLKAALLALALMIPAATASAAIPEPVHVDGGLVTGTLAWGHGVRMYRGIPFAAPPVGSLRWREPQPVIAWSGVKAADHFSPACMQVERPMYQAPWNTGANGYSEDCLYLNVWTPALSADAKLPVMVWIYGGGGREGSGGEALYDPSELARRGVVVVTFNYRVGVLGWMAHPELTAESPHHASGDYGALDQVAALAWVKRNIAAFGGDPARVTIFGESGGSRSVNWVMASPLAHGLFEGAIAQSHTVFGRMETLKESEADGEAFAAAAGAKSLAELRAMPADRIMAVYLAHPEGMNAATVDGWFLPASVRAIFEAGRQNDVPLITGGDWNEPGGKVRRGGPPKTLADYQAWAKEAYGDKAGEVLRLYPAASDAEVAAAYGALLRDGNFAGHRTWAQLQRKTGKAPVWLYLFSQSLPEWSPGGAVLHVGAPHGTDVPYVFDNLRYADQPWSDDDRTLAAKSADYWTNFAKAGDPNGPGLPQWPVYDPAHEQVLNLGTPIKAQPLPNPAGLDFLEAQ